VHGGLELRETGIPFYDDVLVAMFVMGFSSSFYGPELVGFSN
jgi:hypothetical protein